MTYQELAPNSDRQSRIARLHSATGPIFAPSLLACDFARMAQVLDGLASDGITAVHLDVMDGHFVPNFTIGPVVVKALHQVTSIPLDVHLMIERPERYIESFVKAGAHIVTVHAEASTHLQRTLQLIRSLGAKAGVSLNPASSLSHLEHVLPDVDLVLLMTVNPGFGGQKFIPQMIEKIRAARKMIGDLPIELEVDGGIKLENVKESFEAGANVFVSGSGIFENPPYNEIMKKMKTALK